MNKKGILSAILASTFLLGACSGTVSAINADDPSADEDGNLGSHASSLVAGDALVGQGFDSVTRAAKVTQCIEPKDGKWVEQGGASATVDMTMQSDRTKIAESLGINVEGSYGFASAASSFYRSTATDDLSVAYIFGSTTSFKNLSMTTGYRPTSEVGHITSPVTWYSKCGDSVVSGVSRGASLFTAMKLRFASKQDKEKFEASFKVKGIASASAALNKAKEVAGTSVSIEVSAVQVGGLPTELGKVTAGSSEATCGMGDPSACLGYLTAVEKYATKEFPSQFKDASGKPLTGKDLDERVMTVGYKTAPWADLALPNLPDLADLSSKQDKLLMLYEEQFAKQQRIDAINAMEPLANRGAQMRETQRVALLETRDTLKQNQDALRTAWKECYPNESATCTAAFESAKAAQQSIPADSLLPWFDSLTPSGNKPKEFDFVDLRGDGHRDFCWVDEGKVRTDSNVFVCNMGRGVGNLSGSEDIASYRAPLLSYAMAGIRTPPVWVTIGNAKGYCKPSAGGGSLACVTVEGSKTTGTLRFDRINGSWVKKFEGTAEPRGYTQAKLFGDVKNAEKVNHGYDWNPLP